MPEPSKSKFDPSKVRMAVRALVVCVTAFGLKLTADQVAAIYLVTETSVQLFVKDK